MNLVHIILNRRYLNISQPAAYVYFKSTTISILPKILMKKAGDCTSIFNFFLLLPFQKLKSVILSNKNGVLL